MLYIVGTPIGNLSDLSLRQAQTLLSSDIILAEDTRSAGILLQRASKLFQMSRKIDQKLISYYKEKEFEKLSEVLRLLEQDKKVSLISESGMPLVSDPGYLLLRTVIKESIPYTVIPGPSALITALVVSGVKTKIFLFHGFMPKRESEIVLLTNKLTAISEIDPDLVYIFYESPQRINKTLVLLDRYVPNVHVVICRELTKKFEEIIRGKPKELLNRRYKGEITLVLQFSS